MKELWRDWNRSRRQGIRAKFIENVAEEGVLANHPELKTHPIAQHGPLNTRNALYGGRSEALSLYHKIGDGETIQYVDVMSLYTFKC